jgi:integrase
MATLDIDKKTGLKRIRFNAVDGRRKTIRLGRTPKKDAETVCNYVNRLEAALRVGTAPDPDTVQWLAKIAPWLHSKLVKVGLAPEKQSAMLGDFLERYISGRTDVKPRTVLNFNQVRGYLIGFFGADRPLTSITAGDADDFRLDLLRKLGKNTVRRHCGRAKQFFNAAVRRELIVTSPFAHMRDCGVQENRKRDYFVTREQAAKVIDACPDAQWRLLFALGRYGGLRCPSEHLGLRWGDIDWERDRFTVHSPKTEHHPGGDSRQVPIFPELRPYLEAVWEQAEPGSDYVIARYRDSTTNLRTQLTKIIRRAGLEPWPKLWQNLRATRATELVSEGWPEYKVCKWLGHTKLVAEKHYWQLTDDDFVKAAAPRGPILDQTASVQASKAPYKKREGAVFPEEYDPLLTCTNVQIPGIGIEPTTYGLGNHCSIP